MGSVTDPARLKEVIQHFEIETIYHAAAYKHVPMVEHNPEQGFANNLLGTLHAAQVAVISGVSDFVLVSTDKAVRPTNMMGATKRLAEIALLAISGKPELQIFQPQLYGLAENTTIANHTRFAIVRFGNVLDSSGSVIPKFRQQIRDGGPVTVTHPDIIRYFMTMEEAAQLVIQAGSLSEGGEVFLLDMGQPVKISELAEKLIRLSGLKIKSVHNPNGDIEIIYTGLRPGEKLYEELLVEESSKPTNHNRIYRAKEGDVEWSSFTELLDQLQEAFKHKDHAIIRSLLERDEIGYTPNGDISDWLATPPASSVNKAVSQ